MSEGYTVLINKLTAHHAFGTSHQQLLQENIYLPIVNLSEFVSVFLDSSPAI